MSTVTVVRRKISTASPSPARARSAPPADVARAARSAAVATLQHVMEVIDGRRPCEHLVTEVSPDVFGQVVQALKHREAATARAPVRGGAARLVRVHLQLQSSRIAHCFGTLERAGRIRAVAGRIDYREVSVPGRRREPQTRWVLTEFAVL